MCNLPSKMCMNVCTCSVWRHDHFPVAWPDFNIFLVQHISGTTVWCSMTVQLGRVIAIHLYYWTLRDMSLWDTCMSVMCAVLKNESRYVHRRETCGHAFSLCEFEQLVRLEFFVFKVRDPTFKFFGGFRARYRSALCSYMYTRILWAIGIKMGVAAGFSSVYITGFVLNC